MNNEELLIQMGTATTIEQIEALLKGQDKENAKWLLQKTIEQVQGSVRYKCSGEAQRLVVSMQALLAQYH